MPMMAPVERPLEPELDPDAAALEEVLAPDDVEEVEVAEGAALVAGVVQAAPVEHSVNASTDTLVDRKLAVSGSVSPSVIAK